VSTLRIAPGGSRGPNIQDWAQARAQLESQSSKGGPGANTAAQALARAESMEGDPFALMQNTFESSGFSTEPIPVRLCDSGGIQASIGRRSVP
jgi:hypothetical protein